MCGCICELLGFYSKTYKPAKGSLSSSQLFGTSLHTKTNCYTSIKFVKARSKPWHSIKKKIGILHSASDWKLQFDHLDKKLVIPSFIPVSQLRLDIVPYLSPSKLEFT